MGAPSKARTVQLVKVQPEERLATTSELNSAPSPERAAMKPGQWDTGLERKGLGPVITIVSEANIVHVCARQ